MAKTTLDKHNKSIVNSDTLC